MTHGTGDSNREATGTLVEVDVAPYEVRTGATSHWNQDTIFRIEISHSPEDIAIISGNAAGLISVARHLLTLAQAAVPDGTHLDFGSARSGLGGTDPSALLAILNGDDAWHDAAMVQGAESLDGWSIRGYIHAGHATFMARKYSPKRKRLLPGILMSRIPRPEYSAITEAALNYFEQVCSDVGVHLTSTQDLHHPCIHDTVVTEVRTGAHYVDLFLTQSDGGNALLRVESSARIYGFRHEGEHLEAGPALGRAALTLVDSRIVSGMIAEDLTLTLRLTDNRILEVYAPPESFPP